MTDHDIHGCGRAGAWLGVLCAGVGVLIAGLMVRALNIGWIIGFPSLPVELVVGLIALFVAAGHFGKKAGVFVCKRGNDLSTNVLIGIALAFGSIAIAVWAGMIVGLCHELLKNKVPGIGSMFLGLLLGWLFPMLVILIYGGIPAATLGVVYGFLLRNRLWHLRS
jgi:hypothetical protein